MNLNLITLAKSDKHNNYCVAAINPFGQIIRLVRDSEGHALSKEDCNFEKLDLLSADITYAPLKYQRENFVLNKLVEWRKSSLSVNDLKKYLQNPRFIFSNTKSWLLEGEMNIQKSTFTFAEINDLHIYQNDEGKYKADFIYENKFYKNFSITDPNFKCKNRKIAKALILVSLPNIPYNKYGNDLYYKFICAVYPLEKYNKSHKFDCYKI